MKYTIKKIYQKIIFISLSIASLFFASKSIPLIGYLLFRREKISEFLVKSREFISYQSNAGRNWGGESMTIFQNIKNNFNSYKMSEIIIPLSLIFTSLLLLLFIFKICEKNNIKTLEIKYRNLRNANSLR